MILTLLNTQGSLGGPQGGKDLPTMVVNAAVMSKLTSGNNAGAPIAFRKVCCVEIIEKRYLPTMVVNAAVMSKLPSGKKNYAAAHLSPFEW